MFSTSQTIGGGKMDKVTGIKELGGTTFKTDKDIVNAEERAKMRQRMQERAMERTRERRRELSREKYLTRKKIEEAEKELEAHREREKEIDRAQEITRTRMLHQERRRQIEREKENEILFFKKVLGDTVWRWLSLNTAIPIVQHLLGHTRVEKRLWSTAEH